VSVRYLLLSQRVETAAPVLEDRPHRWKLSPIVDLARIAALGRQSGKGGEMEITARLRV
jgi:hypothetical protein